MTIIPIRNRHRFAAAVYLWKKNREPFSKVQALRVLSVLEGSADDDEIVQGYAYIEHPIVRFFLDIRDLWT